MIIFLLFRYASLIFSSINFLIISYVEIAIAFIAILAICLNSLLFNSIIIVLDKKYLIRYSNLFLIPFINIHTENFNYH